MRKPSSGGGWQAIWYTLKKGREAGGLLKLWKAMRTKNACKTCALGMGGQAGGMVNEAGHFPEVCKKSLQAMVADMQGAIRPDFFSTYSIAQLREFTPRQLEACGRLVEPLLLERGNDYYRPISWEDALARFAAALGRVKPDETFWYFSGRSSNEAGFLWQLFARLFGTNNVNNCSYYCHQASGVGLSVAVGSGAGTVTLDDVEGAELVFVIGANPASNHPRLMRTLMTVRRRGGRVVAINPIVETGLVNFRVPSDVRSLLFGSRIASTYVQPHAGGDLALLIGLAKRIIELGAVNQSFVNERVVGWPEWEQSLASCSWDEIVRHSGVSKAQIDNLAEQYARAEKVVFCWTMGITHHVHGVQNVQAIANLALLRGMIGKPNAGLLPIRGHSNVQGLGTIGVAPKLKDAIFERLQSHFSVKLPVSPGLDTMACIEAAAAGRVKAAACLGGNLYGSNPDANYAERALGELDFIAYVNTTLNTGHCRGLAKETLILPVLARDEEPQPTTQESMFSFVRLSEGGPRRHAGPRSEIEIVSQLAERVLGAGGPIDWPGMTSASRIREAIGRIVPNMEQIADLDRTKKEFHIPGRAFHGAAFPTPSGKARFIPLALPESTAANDRLRLMTIRSEGQFNTVVYEDFDLYRGVDRRDAILVHPDDISHLGLQAGQRVNVSSPAGSMAATVFAYADIRPGNVAMYYPEANVIVPRDVDPQSRTPAFKHVRVRIEAAAPMAPERAGRLVAAPVAAGHVTRNDMKAC